MSDGVPVLALLFDFPKNPIPAQQVVPSHAALLLPS
jgi:hypothetical protein